MIDYTSALYLGMLHDTDSLSRWKYLTTGKPAALQTPSLSREIASAVARLQGCESAVLAPSTLHLAWDVLGQLARHASCMYVDSEVYPILRWGVERVRCRGVPVRFFRHHDIDALRRLLYKYRHLKGKPIVVSDGWCPRCGEAAPVHEYLSAAQRFGGYLVIDDTQALGVLGRQPAASQPYGYGGGGLLPWTNTKGPNLLSISSMAKGFGVPVAVLSGETSEIMDFEMQSETRMHCSPPSIVTLHAAAHAIAMNRRQGDAMRARLLSRVRLFKQSLRMLGMRSRGGLFPVQVIGPVSGLPPPVLHAQLLASGIRTLLLQSRAASEVELCFNLNASLSLAELKKTIKTLRAIVESARRPRQLHTVI